MAIHGSPDPLVDARQHVARAGQDGEGDAEQDEAERDQRRLARALLASVNSLAMVEAMVEPELNSDLGK